MQASIVASRKIKTVEWLIFLAILALSAAMRLWRAGTEPLWLDEGYSWWDAQQSLSNLWSLVPQCDPHPPFYFLILKGWMYCFGDSSQALRALSAALGIATTAVVIAAGRELNRNIGWLAGVMFALTPFQIVYGREARPYALLCFGAAVTMWGALRIVRANSRATSQTVDHNPTAVAPLKADYKLLLDWAILLVGSLIALWSNNTAIFVVIAALTPIAFGLIANRRSQTMLMPLLAYIVIVLAVWLPYLPTFLQQARGVVDDFWIPKPNAWYITDVLGQLIGLNSHDATWWAAIALAGGAILLWQRKLRREASILLCMVAIPIILNLVASLILKPIFLPRTLIGIAPAAIIAMASAATLLKLPSIRYAMVTTLIATHVIALHIAQLSDGGSEPWDKIALELTAHTNKSSALSEDAIVLLTANELALPLEHAFEDIKSSIPVEGAPANFPSPGLHARYPSGKCAPAITGQDLSRIAQSVAAHHVVYFVTRTDNVYDPNSAIVKLLRSIGFTQTLQETFSPGALELHKFVASIHPKVAPVAARKRG